VPGGPSTNVKVPRRRWWVGTSFRARERFGDESTFLGANRELRASVGQRELAPVDHVLVVGVPVGALSGDGFRVLRRVNAIAVANKQPLVAAEERERSLIGARTKAALARKSARRERVGSVPLGFRVGDDGKTLEHDEGEQRALERMRALREEGLSMVRIAQALTSEGVPSRSGNAWNPGQVHRVLRRAA
jgi:hypothetical protein